jgi:fused signal recognition particle receptor
MASWWKALTRTREVLRNALGKVFKGLKRVDASTLEELEEALIRGDLPAPLAAEIIEKLRREAKGDKAEIPRAALRAILLDALGPAVPIEWSRLPKPAVVLLLGINGGGKTTTTAKLAHHARAQGLRPLLCAADTFRAAGTDQLRLWAQRLDCDIVAGIQGADAAAVAFDGVEAAVSRQVDVLFIDTAGRMHTKQPLMDELGKMVRSIRKRLPEAPHHIWLVLDASLGQNALHQARVFHGTIPLTGIVITKLDGSAKAGFLFAVKRELQVPILFAGLGEQAEDLVPFNPVEFVDGLVGGEDEPAA